MATRPSGAYTDTPAGVPLSNVVDTDLLPAGRPALSTRVGTGAVTVSSPGAVIGTFGQYSSVELDPSVPGNSCAVSAQEYAGATGWLTRLVRFGTC